MVNEEIEAIGKVRIVCNSDLDPEDINAASGRQGRLADHLTRLDFVILDELGYLPFAQAAGQLLFHLVSLTFMG